MKKKKTQAQFSIATGSHPGMTGKQNEDRFRVTSFFAGPDRIPCVFAVLCDGIGGHHAGEIAAEMGVSIITERVTNADPDQPLAVLTDALRSASSAIHQASLTSQGRLGMGTTCACAWVIDNRLYTTNLGDSRIYLLRDNHILQLTTDHTWVQEAIDAGMITEDDKEHHPNAHIIRRFLGSQKPADPDFRLWFFESETDEDALQNQGMQIIPGDNLLLCSDGITDLIADEEIQNVIQSTPLSKAPDQLIQLANSRGGHDNATLILLEHPLEKNRKLKNLMKKRWLAGCLSILILIAALLTAVILSISWFRGDFQNKRTPSPTMTQTLPAQTDQFPVEITDTSIPTTTNTQQPPSELPTAQFTITPWPTHTSFP